MRATLAALACLLFTACGSDYAPRPSLTTGALPAPLDQRVDVVAELPNLQIEGALERGATLELLLAFERGGTGTIDGRFVSGVATYLGGSAPVTATADGVTLLFDGSSWRVSGIGTLRVGLTRFSLTLDGSSADEGFTIAGDADESQTALGGSFSAWRRQRFLVATSDFFGSSGTLAEVSLIRGELLEVRDGLEAVSADCVLAVGDGAVWAINRLGFDNLQRLDPAAGYATAFQAPLGVGANPHGLASVDGRLFVSRYEPPFDDLALVAASDGELTGSIDLSSLSESADATPRADRVAVAGGRVGVLLQEIDRTFTDYAEGKLAVIEPLGEQVVGVVPLGGKNPGALVPLPDGTLRIALSGIFPGLLPQELSGGIVDVDPLALTVVRDVLDDDVAGGNLGALASDAVSRGWVVVSDASFLNRVVAFDAITGEVLRTLFESTALIPELALAGGGALAIPDRDLAAPGLCLWRVPAPDAPAGSVELPLGCAPLSNAPFSVVALD